jgi:hypothetical protein
MSMTSRTYTLHARGVAVSDVQDFPWGRFCFFADPDGNGSSVHEPPRAGQNGPAFSPSP